MCALALVLAINSLNFKVKNYALGLTSLLLLFAIRPMMGLSFGVVIFLSIILFDNSLIRAFSIFKPKFSLSLFNSSCVNSRTIHKSRIFLLVVIITFVIIVISLMEFHLSEVIL